ncbi:hypothetical protein LOC68_23980 [Blastopirellula sp. JC732]|uniref:Uncharacterized protein n=1 Tax=Blastopirellula sediminis TaxID=2894196 RepID=A0A9X1SJ33_9BACT|nr:hypothetical protein [Blastopirellula sediminis]MCC9605234.1 hypothetical protein [Blastopirellula sediminis]MCC9631466.1 hypothetical protein [Blastopirellula sediminis]
MSNVDQAQDVAAATTPPMPSRAVYLALGLVVVATLTASSHLRAIPKLIQTCWQFRVFGPGMPNEFYKAVQPFHDLQLVFIGSQAIRIPLGVIVAVILIWGAANLLRLRPQGDRFLRYALAIAAAWAAIATGFDIYFQFAVSRLPLSMMENVPISQSSGASDFEMDLVFWNLFFVGLAYSLGILLLQFGYYVYTYRYFSKPEIRALY